MNKKKYYFGYLSIKVIVIQKSKFKKRNKTYYIINTSELTVKSIIVFLY